MTPHRLIGLVSRATSRDFVLLALGALVSILSFASPARTSDMTQRDMALLQSLWNRADVDSAVIIARDLTHKYPDNPYPFTMLGRLLLNPRKPELYPEAEAALAKSLALNPPQPWMTGWNYCSLAYIYYETGRDSLGAAYCAKAIDLNATANCTAAAKKLLYLHTSRKEQASFPVTRTSAHFVFHYADTTGTGKGLAWFESAYERAYSRLADFWHVEPPAPTHVYVYRTEPDIESVFGKAGHFAFPEKHEIHTTPRATTGHELTHVFAYQLNDTQRNPVIGEGIASALDQYRSRVLADYYAARALKASPALTIAGLNAGWHGSEEDYWLSCSFVYGLLHRYGPERFLALYRMKGPLEESVAQAYGTGLDVIERSWRARVDSIGEDTPAVDSLMQQLSRRDYASALASIDLLRPRYGDAADLIVLEGQCLSKLGRHGEAIDLLKGICSRKPDPLEPPRVLQMAQYYMGRSLAESGRKEEAAGHLKDARAMETDRRLTAAADSLLRALRE